MNLRLNKFALRDVQFGEVTSLRDGVLYINKDELEAHLSDDPRIAKVELELARPGESVRIIPIKDIVQPRWKVDGPGQMFPGFIGDHQQVGSGVTNILENCAVVTCGRIVNFQEGIIDMQGLGAQYNTFSKMNLIVPLFTPVERLDKHSHEEAVRIGGLKAATYLARASVGMEPDEVEDFHHETILESARKYPNLPRVVYVYMLQGQGLMHDTYLYGLNVRGMISSIIGPTEVMDGAIVSGNCAAPCHKNATIHHQNNPIILDLLRRHGKELCFAGVIVANESTMLADKQRGAYYSTKLAQLLEADGAVISEEGGGNPETDLMLHCRHLEKAGIKTVLVTDEYAGRDGRSPGLADTTVEADAVVTNGNGNQLVTLPKMDRIIGFLDSVEIITGGFSGSLNQDGSITVEIASIMGSCCELGYERLTTRMR